MCGNENKGGQTLKFIVAPQYEGKESNLIELGKKLTKEHQILEIKEAYRSTMRRNFLIKSTRICRFSID